MILEIKTEKGSNKEGNYAYIGGGEEEVLFLPFCWFEVVNTESTHLCGR